MSYIESLLSQHEKLIFRTHQHWITLAVSFLVNLVLLLLILFIAAIVWIPLQFQLGWLTGLLVLIPIARFVYHYIAWDNREYLITNRRVIQLSGVLNKNVFDSSLEKVNDVRMHQSLAGRMFDYGDVEIMTAAEEGENLFKHIAKPVKFKTAMLNQKEAMGTSEDISAPPKASDVPTLIAGLDALRKQGLITEEEFQRKKQELLARM